MEHLLLKVLDFRVSQPTANWFLTYYLRFIRLNTNLGESVEAFLRIEYLARFLCELTLLDGDLFLVFVPSQVAAAAVYLSLYTFGKAWTKQIADIMMYGQDLGELRECIVEMFGFWKEAGGLAQQAVQEKYKQAKYEHASLIEAPKLLPALFYATVTAQSSSVV